MAELIADNLEVCQDCAQVIANGECIAVDGAVGGGYYDRAPEIAALWSAQGWDGSTLVLACDGDDESACSDFSKRPCDACGDHLAGSRHLASALA